MRMFSDPVTMKEIVRFLVVITLGCLSYVAATLAARLISPVPRHIYIGRLVFLGVFVLFIFMFYLPHMAVWWTGPRTRYYELK